LKDPMPQGALRHVLLPQSFACHRTRSTEFTIVAVEIWTTVIVVNVHLAEAEGSAPSVPGLSVEDHHGTLYSLQTSRTVGSRNLQIFGPSMPPGTRSLTIRSSEAGRKCLIVSLAVPRTPKPLKG
jgi:hypothetical protein